MANVLIPEQEIWVDIPGFEGLYKVSSFGRVKSLSRPVYRKLINGYITLKPRILKQGYTQDGYRQVQIYKMGRHKTFGIHRLVFWSFNPHIKKMPGYEVDHIDNDKENNHLSNLQYIKSRHNSTKRSMNSKKSSRFPGVHLDSNRNRWVAGIRYEKRWYHLGSYDNEFEAAATYQKALMEIEQGVFHKEIKKPTSQYLGVFWHTKLNKWFAIYQKNYLGVYDCELDAHKAVENAKNGILKPKRVKTSKYRGVSFNKAQGYWYASPKGKYIGRFKTEEEAYAAYQEAVKNDPKK